MNQDLHHGLLKVNPAAKDERKRSQRDEEPEKSPLKERSNANFAESPHGEPSSNQVERDSQADNAKMLQHRIRGLEDVNVGVGDRREAEEENEPWPLDTRFALVCHCGSDRSEEHTSELQSLRHLVCR